MASARVYTNILDDELLRGMSVHNQIAVLTVIMYCSQYSAAC